MKRKNKRIVSYIIIPLLYSILSLLCIFVLGAPLIKTYKETAFAMIKQNTPNDITTYVMNQPNQGDGTVKEEIKPDLGTSYAMLLCERIGLKAEVYYGDSGAEFKNGIGQYANGVFPWNQGAILLGGHDTTYFASLEDIKEEDIVLIRTNQKEYQFQVEGIEIVDADSITDEILTSEDRLILYTCYPFGEISKDRTERYLVYCKRLF